MRAAFYQSCRSQAGPWPSTADDPLRTGYPITYVARACPGPPQVLRARCGAKAIAANALQALAYCPYARDRIYICCTSPGAARKLWAMAVDGFIPPGLAAVNPTTRVPVRAAVLTALILAVPGLLMLAGWVAGGGVRGKRGETVQGIRKTRKRWVLHTGAG